jgi:hypothetical protein
MKTTELQLKEFATYNQKLFYNAEARHEEYQPLASPSASYITMKELKHALEHNYKATKSRGGS